MRKIRTVQLNVYRDILFHGTYCSLVHKQNHKLVTWAINETKPKDILNYISDSITFTLTFKDDNPDLYRRLFLP
jgi:hypothetical protein